MHLYEKPRGQYRGLAFAAVAFALLAAVFLLALGAAARRGEASEIEMVTAAIQRGIVTCYAVEGKYPRSLSYLYEHYGVSVDESRYAVSYDVIAANLMPSVRVSRIGGGS